MKSLVFRAPVLALCVLAACSSSSGGTTPAATDAGHDAGHDAKSTPVDAGHIEASATHDSGIDAQEDALSPTDSPAPGDVSVDAPVTDAPFDAEGYTPEDGGDAVISAPANAWTWVPFPDSHCRDGSTTGIGVNMSPSGSNRVVLYFEGGGACFNAATCGTNPSSFGAGDLPQRFPAESDGGVPQPGNGILDRGNTANPVGDWNFVYVPYCTGDIHAGNNPNGVVPDVTGTQMFVGYNNVNLYLQRLVPTFASATQVLLTGVSGGGFGSAANVVQVQRAFGAIPVTLLDDSGPFMEDPYLPVCLQNETRAIWGLDSTVGADCAGACNDPYSFFLDFARSVISKNPTRRYGLIESTDDGTITEFFGFGAQDCNAILPVPETATMFEAGLTDIRTQLAADTNAGSFYFDGTVHTTIGDDDFYGRSTTGADGGVVLLTDWVAALVGGSTSNVGP